MKQAEQRARDLLRELGIESPPVPVEEIVERLGAAITREPFRGGISGMLYRTGGRASSVSTRLSPQPDSASPWPTRSATSCCTNAGR